MAHTRRLAPVLLAALAVAVSSLVARPAPAAAADPSLPLAGITIAIDAGHNGGNASHRAQISRLVWVGTVWKPCNKVGTSTRSGFPEHRFNWVVANKVKTRLQALGATVYLTRTSDTGWGPCVTTRGRFGAKVGAALTVSIHADGAASTNRGFFVMRPAWIKGYTDDIYNRSTTLAKAVRAGLRAKGIPQANYYTPTGIKVRRDMGTLNLSDVPVVEVELGNMKNPSDARRMTTITGRNRYADGLVRGIRIFLGK
jgi:N-acetylmuramoyl-L-alanine amidase